MGTAQRAVRSLVRPRQGFSPGTLGGVWSRFRLSKLGRGVPGIWWMETRDASKRPATQRAAAQHRTTRPELSQALEEKGPALGSPRNCLLLLLLLPPGALPNPSVQEPQPRGAQTAEPGPRVRTLAPLAPRLTPGTWLSSPRCRGGASPAGGRCARRAGPGCAPRGRGPAPVRAAQSPRLPGGSSRPPVRSSSGVCRPSPRRPACPSQGPAGPPVSLPGPSSSTSRLPTPVFVRSEARSH